MDCVRITVSDRTKCCYDDAPPINKRFESQGYRKPEYDVEGGWTDFNELDGFVE